MYFRTRILVLLLSFTVISFSCQKNSYDTITYGNNGNGNGGGVSNGLTGIWDFVSINTNCQTIQGFNSRGKYYESKTLLNYTTEDNSGKVIIYDTIITTTGLNYTVAGNANVYNYVDSVFKDSSLRAYNAKISLPNSVSAFTKSGNDSITFINGEFIYVPTPLLKMSPPGAKISFKGDTLFLTENLYKDSTYKQAITKYHVVQTGTSVITLTKHF